MYGFGVRAFSFLFFKGLFEGPKGVPVKFRRSLLLEETQRDWDVR